MTVAANHVTIFLAIFSPCLETIFSSCFYLRINHPAMADLSEEDCLVIRGFPLEPTIGHLRKPLQQAIESNSTDSQKTKAFSSEKETESDSTKAGEETKSDSTEAGKETENDLTKAGEETENDSTEAGEEPGIVHTNTTVSPTG